MNTLANSPPQKGTAPPPEGAEWINQNPGTYNHRDDIPTTGALAVTSVPIGIFSFGPCVMKLDPKERKLLILALDRAAHPGEADNAAVAFIRLLKVRFGDGYKVLAELETQEPLRPNRGFVDYGNGQWRVASSPRIGAKKNRPGSLAINLEGPYAGCWRDWSDNSHGAFVSLLSRRLNLTFQDAARSIASCLGIPIEQ